jgi:uncharacterized protein (TIGR02466 family)
MVVDYQGPELAMIQEEIDLSLAKIELKIDDTRHMVKTSYGLGINDIITHNLYQLRQSIDESLLNYQQQTTGKATPLRIVESWVNEYGPGGYMSDHEHPGNIISGVYYHKADAECGALIFRNPNLLMLNCHWPGHDLEHFQTVPIPVQEGRLILFPSWMAHSVSTIKSTRGKTSISFNLQ